MHPRQFGRIMAALGGLLLVSSLVTWLIGAAFFVAVKLAISAVCFAIFFATNWRHLGTRSHGQGSFFVGVTVISGIGLATLLAVLNYAAAKRPVVFDLTKDRVHQLSAGTTAVLSGLDDDVSVLAFYRPGDDGYQDAKALLERMAPASKKLSVRIVDPLKEPLLAKQAGIRDDGARIVVKGPQREARANQATEEALVNAIRQVSTEGRQRVAFLVGHGETRIGETGESGLSRMVARMKSEGLDAVEMRAKELTDEVSLAIIAGPVADYSKDELAALRRFLLRGGRLLAMPDPSDAPRPNLESFFREFDIAVDSGFLVTDAENRLAGASETVPLVSDYNPGEAITKGFHTSTAFPSASPVRVMTENPHEGLAVTQLCFTARTARAVPVSPAEKKQAPSDTPSLQTSPDIAPQPAPSGEEAEVDGQAAAPVVAMPSEGDGSSDVQASSVTEEGVQAEAPVKEEGESASAEASQEAAPKPPDGPYAMAVRASAFMPPLTEGGRDLEFRVLVFGGSGFATNGFQGLLGNEELFLNSVNWLASREDRIQVEPRARAASRLFMTPMRQAQLFFLLIDLLPLTILAFGLALWMIRRSK